MAQRSEETTIETSRVRLEQVVRELYRRPSSTIGATLFLIFLVIALIGPVVAPYGANDQIIADAREPPSLKHPFGTDNLGRDVFSRVLLGAREVLTLAGSGTLLAVLLERFGDAVTVGGELAELLGRVGGYLAHDDLSRLNGGGRARATDTLSARAAARNPHAVERPTGRRGCTDVRALPR